ncbi:MAG: hypothetical protein AAGD25_15215 [Cyanobacteria bacterium P01_F01_bin.150]
MSQASNTEVKEKRTQKVVVYMTPSEYERLQNMTTEGGCNLSFGAVARQRIFHSSPTHHSTATLQANLQRAYQGLSHIYLCLQYPLDEAEHTKLRQFTLEVIRQIDQTIIS